MRVQQASREQLMLWGDRVLDAASLEQVFAEPAHGFLIGRGAGQAILLRQRVLYAPLPIPCAVACCGNIAAGLLFRYNPA